MCMYSNLQVVINAVNVKGKERWTYYRIGRSLHSRTSNTSCNDRPCISHHPSIPDTFVTRTYPYSLFKTCKNNKSSKESMYIAILRGWFRPRYEAICSSYVSMSPFQLVSLAWLRYLIIPTVAVNVAAFLCFWSNKKKEVGICPTQVQQHQKIFHEHLLLRGSRFLHPNTPQHSSPC